VVEAEEGGRGGRGRNVKVPMRREFLEEFYIFASTASTAPPTLYRF